VQVKALSRALTTGVNAACQRFVNGRGMNYGWAEAKVAEFIAGLDQHRIEWAVRMSTQSSESSTLPQLEATINEKLLTIAAIATEINPGLNEGLSKIDGGYSWPHKSQLQASQLLLGAIRDRVELAENLGPQGPRLLGAQFHQWVWLPAANVWEIGHRRDAIQRAATSVFDDQLRAKVDSSSQGRSVRPGRVVI
jgi:hypothetical protein